MALGCRNLLFSILSYCSTLFDDIYLYVGNELNPLSNHIYIHIYSTSLCPQLLGPFVSVPYYFGLFVVVTWCFGPFRLLNVVVLAFCGSDLIYWVIVACCFGLFVVVTWYFGSFGLLSPIVLAILSCCGLLFWPICGCGQTPLLLVSLF